jgi:hypothetical protein
MSVTSSVFNAHKLNDEEKAALRNIARGGAMQEATPPHLQESLLAKGYILQKLGGLAATTIGRMYDAREENV